MNSKGQVVVFVILGIILLLSVVVFFVLKGAETDNREEIISTLSEIEEIATVQVFVEGCLDLVGERAIRRAGLQGGYTQESNMGLRASYFDSTDSDGFFITPQSNLMTPYWHYLLSPNSCESDCLFYSQRPTLRGESALSVESQIERFTEDHINECLGGFTEFLNEGYEIAITGDASVDVLIRETDVKMILDMPLAVNKGDIFGTVSQFTTDYDVNLEKIYTLAAILSASQTQYNFLEIHAIELLSHYSGFDNDRLPPFSGSEFNFVPQHFWSVEDVANKIQGILTVYTGGLQVAPASNYRKVEVDDDYVSKNAIDKVFENMVLPVQGLDEEFSDVSVSFEYLNWPWYFDVNSNGGVIQPDSVAIDWFPFFGIQKYRTYYDISYPVRVVLKDTSAFGGKGFTFAIGLEANVRENEPMTPDYQRLTTAYKEVSQSALCNFDQRNTDTINVSVVETGVGQPVEGITLIYSCGDESCPLGKTDENGQFSDNFPICGGGVLSVLHEDYEQSGIRYSTTAYQSDSISLEVAKIVEIPFIVKKLPLQKTTDGTWKVSQSYSDLDFDEYATVTLNRVGSPFSAAGTYYGSTDPNSKPILRMAPGDYSVDVYLVKDETIIIPEQNRSVSGKKFTVPEVVLDTFPAGSLTLDENTRFWSISAQELANKNELVFYTISIELSEVPENNRSIEDLNLMSQIEEISLDELLRLMPK